MDKELISRIKDKLEQENAVSIILVGSFARNEGTKSSDIDLIVEFRDRKSLLDLVRIERELSEQLDHDVDLLTRNSIHPAIYDSMKKDMVVVV